MLASLNNSVFETKKEAVQFGAIELIKRNLITDPGILTDSPYWGWNILSDEEGSYEWRSIEYPSDYYRLNAIKGESGWRITVELRTEDESDIFWSD